MGGERFVRFVRFVYDPGYVTANVGPVGREECTLACATIRPDEDGGLQYYTVLLASWDHSPDVP